MPRWPSLLMTWLQITPRPLVLVSHRPGWAYWFRRLPVVPPAWRCQQRKPPNQAVEGFDVILVTCSSTSILPCCLSLLPLLSASRPCFYLLLLFQCPSENWPLRRQENLCTPSPQSILSLPSLNQHDHDDGVQHTESETWIQFTEHKSEFFTWLRNLHYQEASNITVSKCSMTIHQETRDSVNLFMADLTLQCSAEKKIIVCYIVGHFFALWHTSLHLTNETQGRSQLRGCRFIPELWSSGSLTHKYRVTTKV